MKNYPSIREVKTVRPAGSSDLRVCITDALKLANKKGCDVHIELNNTSVMVLPGMDADQIYVDYHTKQQDQR